MLDPLLLSLYISSLSAVISSHGVYCYADNRHLFLSFPSDDTILISTCLAGISAWMKRRHLQINLSKAELIVCSASPSLVPQISMQLDSITLLPVFCQESSVMVDKQLTFKVHVAADGRFCQFGLYNIRRLRPYLNEHIAQLIVQTLIISCIRYNNFFLAGLPACSGKPLQIIHNATSTLQHTSKSKLYFWLTKQ